MFWRAKTIHNTRVTRGTVGTLFRPDNAKYLEVIRIQFLGERLSSRSNHYSLSANSAN